MELYFSSRKKLNISAYAESAAKFLAVERAVRGVGVDVISIDPGNQNVVSSESEFLQFYLNQINC